jgi:hypothetical protein
MSGRIGGSPNYGASPITTNENPAASPFALAGGSTQTPPPEFVPFKQEWVQYDSFGVPLMHQEAHDRLMAMVRHHLPREDRTGWNVQSVTNLSNDAGFPLTARDVTTLYRTAHNLPDTGSMQFNGKAPYVLNRQDKQPLNVVAGPNSSLGWPTRVVALMTGMPREDMSGAEVVAGRSVQNVIKQVEQFITENPNQRSFNSGQFRRWADEKRIPISNTSLRKIHAAAPPHFFQSPFNEGTLTVENFQIPDYTLVPREAPQALIAVRPQANATANNILAKRPASPDAFMSPAKHRTYQITTNQLALPQSTNGHTPRWPRAGDIIGLTYTPLANLPVTAPAIPRIVTNTRLPEQPISNSTLNYPPIQLSSPTAATLAPTLFVPNPHTAPTGQPSATSTLPLSEPPLVLPAQSFSLPNFASHLPTSTSPMPFPAPIVQAHPPGVLASQPVLISELNQNAGAAFSPPTLPITTSAPPIVPNTPAAERPYATFLPNAAGQNPASNPLSDVGQVPPPPAHPIEPPIWKPYE